ncbi:MAG: hypothetical protein ABI876_04170 [Bacteroidota bacterium]
MQSIAIVNQYYPSVTMVFEPEAEEVDMLLGESFEILPPDEEGACIYFFSSIVILSNQVVTSPDRSLSQSGPDGNAIKCFEMAFASGSEITMILETET